MKKKIKFFWVIFIFLVGCGYEPIYSSKNINFSINEIQKENTQLNNEFTRALKTFSNKNALNQLKIKIDSKKNIEIKSKNSKGNPNVYELSITLKIVLYENNNNMIVEKVFNRNINFDNRDDKFELSQYEKELEKLLINKIIEDVLKFLSNL
tara:strand:- start:932 stop:1387 length:456 start_codon:yes stop_codon:yes gene_type:complete